MKLAEEISRVKAKYIRKFTEEAFAAADANFWKAPASSSGKYHPPEDLGEGGLVRHSIKAGRVAECFARRAKFSEIELDMAISAALLHDVCKNGVPWGEHTDYTHGLIASEWLKQFKLADAVVKEIILNAVRFHMAPWCYAVDPFKNRNYSKEEMLKNIDELSRALTNPSRVELAVREGDYWASQKDMSFYPGKTIAFDPRLHDTPEEWLETLKRGLK